MILFGNNGRGDSLGRRAPRLAAIASIALFAVALAGCSSPAVPKSAKDPSAKARLDYATGEIILPLDAYDVLDTWQDRTPSSVRSRSPSAAA
ncbi:MAG: hypothetical protein WDM88_00250 [Galbitalea sp.]